MIDLPPRYTAKGKSFEGGGMSSVFLCRDCNLDRDVLVKTLLADVGQDRLLDEITALTSIRSKHVVQIYDVIKDEDGDIVGIVQEFISGKEVGDLAPIANVSQFLKTLHSIAAGIADIHRHNLVHRDIKPNNMKLDSEGCLKIYDFGLSRLNGISAATVGVVGTPGYLAPELCVDDDEAVQFSKEVDVYAFGASALKLIAGAIPPKLRKLPPQLPCAEADFTQQPLKLPVPIAKMLNDCLNANPASRPAMQTVRDLIASYLLKDQHKATLVVQRKRHVLDRSNPIVNIRNGDIGSFQIAYDGLNFRIKEIEGQIYVNAGPVKPNQILPEACVIIIGAPSLQNARSYITVDLSYPEVAL